MVTPHIPRVALNIEFHNTINTPPPILQDPKVEGGSVWNERDGIGHKKLLILQFRKNESNPRMNM